MEEIYFAGGCLWGVQEYFRHLPGVVFTEAGRANGTTSTTQSDYDGYAECVRLLFDPQETSVAQLMTYLFEVIDPYSINQQGQDVGKKYRTGVYSKHQRHLAQAQHFIAQREDAGRIAVEIRPLSNYVRSDDEHQDRLLRCPDDYCHIPKDVLYRHKKP